jgi:alpha-beta hydrolase superfamily lysophospholipase
MTESRSEEEQQRDVTVLEQDHQGVSSPAMTLPQWRYAPDAWRWARRLDVRYVDMLFKARSARVIPTSARIRFIEMGIPADVVDETLGRIRRARDWSNQWIETAQRYLGDSRRQTSAMNVREAAQARQTAALCYHAAQIFEIFDRRTMSKCRSAAASLFTQTLPHLHPNVRHLWVPWRTTSLPAYFQVPDPVNEPVGLVVILNGASMSKEETFAWSGRFLDQGYAVMSLDSPGTGEASSIAGADADQDDILDGIFEIFGNEPIIDLNRVVALGSSLGANQAVRAAARDRRIMAAVAVTPPYEPARWLHRASPLLLNELEFMVDEESVPETMEKVARFSLAEVALGVRQPMLIFGGGRDVIVPPNESQLLAERVGERGTLVWYPEGGHCLYEITDRWCFDAATWITAVDQARKDPESGQDPARVAARGRQALNSTAYEPKSRLSGDSSGEDFTEYARLITQNRESSES